MLYPRLPFTNKSPSLGGGFEQGSSPVEGGLVTGKPIEYGAVIIIIAQNFIVVNLLLALTG